MNWLRHSLFRHSIGKVFFWVVMGVKCFLPFLLCNLNVGLMELMNATYDVFHVCRTIYNMCTQKPPHDYSQQLYDKYRESFEEYIISSVRNIISSYIGFV